MARVGMSWVVFGTMDAVSRSSRPVLRDIGGVALFSSVRTRFAADSAQRRRPGGQRMSDDRDRPERSWSSAQRPSWRGEQHVSRSMHQDEGRTVGPPSRLRRYGAPKQREEQWDAGSDIGRRPARASRWTASSRAADPAASDERRGRVASFPPRWTSNRVREGGDSMQAGAWPGTSKSVTAPSIVRLHSTADLIPHGFEALFGKSPVQAALETASRETAGKIFVQEGTELLETDSALQSAISGAGLTVVRLPKQQMNNLTDNRPHQGLVLPVGPFQAGLAKEGEEPQAAPLALPLKTGPIDLALDEIMDPMNVGAILRSALFFGVRRVYMSSKNSCRLSPVVSKASSGALEYFKGRIHRVDHMDLFLKFLASDCNYCVVGTALEAGQSGLSGDCNERPHQASVPWPSFRDVCRSMMSVPAPAAPIPADSVLDAAGKGSRGLVLVLGNEGSGLKPAVLEACTLVTKIDDVGGSSALTSVDSLNVSVAAGILLETIIRALPSHRGSME